MENPFETIARRLCNIEELLLDLKHKPLSNSSPDADPYGDFNWLAATCSGVPASTLRIKSAAGEIPGVIKLGKRVLYEKARVLSWLRSQTGKPVPNTAVIEQAQQYEQKRPLRKRSRGGNISA